jgi:hypothetical protein
LKGLSKPPTPLACPLTCPLSRAAEMSLAFERASPNLQPPMDQKQRKQEQALVLVLLQRQGRSKRTHWSAVRASTAARLQLQRRATCGFGYGRRWLSGWCDRPPQRGKRQESD